MFDFRRKNQYEFGSVSPDDDRDIEVVQLRRESRQGIWTESLRLVRDIFLIIVVFILFGVFAVQPVVVEGTSMLPQLNDGERLLVNKLVYYKIQGVSWGHLERGDIVVFWFPKEPDKSYVKRIIGLPGESVEGQERKSLYRWSAAERGLSRRRAQPFAATFHPTKVEEHHYFVMGDNRDNSSDSRYWGLVPEKYIYGKAFFRYWKPSNMGFLEHGACNDINAPPKPRRHCGPNDRESEPAKKLQLRVRSLRRI
jgi:signal peptidase I